MKNHSLERAFKRCIVASAVLLAVQAHADSHDEGDPRNTTEG